MKQQLSMLCVGPDPGGGLWFYVWRQTKDLVGRRA